MADVFVSYARSDKLRVAPLVAAIEAQGWSVWWDPEIAPGQEFDRQITAELKIAAAVLVVWTPNSVESRWVRGEAREGAERGILVPVRFEGATLPIDVRTLHTTDFDSWGNDPRSPQVQEVLRALDSLIGRHGASLSGFAQDIPAPVTTDRVAICVLPFANMSGDPEQEYFSEGISEDIITDLSKVSALFVVAGNTAFSVKGKNVDVSQVARQLKVSHVLEGSVRKAGGRVRISAQLIQGDTGGHVWAERYDRDLDDIFALQDEISQAIVKALKLKLLPEEKMAIEQRGTTNLEAYNLYLMARQQYTTGSEGDVRRNDAIIRLCRRATEIDPQYAQAWALLALGQVLVRLDTGKGEDGLAAAERALELDPNLATAHAVMARILSQAGRHDAASEEIEVALRLDPESYEVHRAAAYSLYRLRSLPGAIRHFEKALALVETDMSSANMLAACYTALGDRASALRAAQSRARARTEDPGAGSEERCGDGLLCVCPGAPRARGKRQGLDESRAAHRSGQHEHALQLRVFARGPVARRGRGARRARAAVRGHPGRPAEPRQGRSGSGSPARRPALQGHDGRGRGTPCGG